MAEKVGAEPGKLTKVAASKSSEKVASDLGKVAVKLEKVDAKPESLRRAR